MLGDRFSQAWKPDRDTPNALHSHATGQMVRCFAMKTNFNYAGFDFDTVWAAPNQNGQGGQTTAYYPQLYALSRVVAVTPAATSRVYGNGNPGLIASYTGLRPGSFTTSLGSLTTTANAGTNVGNYAITASGAAVTGASGSYRIFYVPAATALSVTQRALTVTADAQSRAYGDANPALTYQVGGRGLVNGDMLTGSHATAATTTSGVGNYAITQNTLMASGNYALSYVSADLTVTLGPVLGRINGVALASNVVRDAFDPIALPDNASPVTGTPFSLTSDRTGVLYSDPRFDQIFVCFGGGGNTAQACFAAR